MSEQTQQVEPQSTTDDQTNSTPEASGSSTATAELRPRGRRPKVQRRRQIDPTTCERDYKQDEIEFMTAMDKYKRENGRPFPTCGEVLDVLHSLGYRRDEGEKNI